MEEKIYPSIDQERCTGCGECVETCPAGALAVIDGKAQLADPDACSYCADCEDVCPQGAIDLPYEVDFEDE